MYACMHETVDVAHHHHALPLQCLIQLDVPRRARVDMLNIHARHYRHYAKFTTRTVRKMGNILGGDMGPPKRKQKTPNFCSRGWQDRGARGGLGASRPVKARPEPAASCDNLARLASAFGLR